jgi:hypothetical protein
VVEQILQLDMSLILQRREELPLEVFLHTLDWDVSFNDRLDVHHEADAVDFMI